MRARALAALLLLLAAGDAAAQRPLVAGEWVRLFAPSVSHADLDARVISVEQGVLRLALAGGERSIALESILEIHRASGRRRAVGAVYGAGAGLAAGVGLGLVCATLCRDGALAPVGGAVVGVPAGLVLGAVFLAPVRWQPVAAPSLERSGN
jgi:hypothetical protein